MFLIFLSIVYLMAQNNNLEYCHFADTFHDFGKNDSRCKFDKKNIYDILKEIYINIDIDTYVKPENGNKYNLEDNIIVENKVRDYILTKITNKKETFYDIGVYQFYQNNKDQKIGVIFDYAIGFRASSYKDPNGSTTATTSGPQQPNLYNINTIANDWDMAIKKEKFKINTRIIPTDSNVNQGIFCTIDCPSTSSSTDASPSTDAGQISQIKFGYKKILDVLPAFKYRNFVQIGENCIIDETIIQSNILQLTVSNLCKVIHTIFHRKEETIEQFHDFLKTLITKHFINENIKLGDTLPKIGMLIGKLTKYFIDAVPVDIKDYKYKYINFLFDIKRSMDAGQVEITKVLNGITSEFKIEYKYLNKPWLPPPQLKYICMSSDILCYTRAQVQEINAIMPKGFNSFYSTSAPTLEEKKTYLMFLVDKLKPMLNVDPVPVVPYIDHLDALVPVVVFDPTPKEQITNMSITMYNNYVKHYNDCITNYNELISQLNSSKIDSIKAEAAKAVEEAVEEAVAAVDIMTKEINNYISILNIYKKARVSIDDTLKLKQIEEIKAIIEEYNELLEEARTIDEAHTIDEARTIAPVIARTITTETHTIKVHITGVAPPTEVSYEELQTNLNNLFKKLPNKINTEFIKKDCNFNHKTNTLKKQLEIVLGLKRDYPKINTDIHDISVDNKLFFIANIFEQNFNDLLFNIVAKTFIKPYNGPFSNKFKTIENVYRCTISKSMIRGSAVIKQDDALKIFNNLFDNINNYVSNLFTNLNETITNITNLTNIGISGGTGTRPGTRPGTRRRLCKSIISKSCKRSKLPSEPCQPIDFDDILELDHLDDTLICDKPEDYILILSNIYTIYVLESLINTNDTTYIYLQNSIDLESINSSICIFLFNLAKNKNILNFKYTDIYSFLTDLETSCRNKRHLIDDGYVIKHQRGQRSKHIKIYTRICIDNIAKRVKNLYFDPNNQDISDDIIDIDNLVVGGGIKKSWYLSIYNKLDNTKNYLQNSFAKRLLKSKIKKVRVDS